MRVLVVGGYGLIGLEIARRVSGAGHDVSCLGRSAKRGQALMPSAVWVEADLAALTRPDSWLPHLASIDVVINAAGALQDGLHDNLVGVQEHAIVALVKACVQAEVKKFIQISAPGAAPEAETTFLATKGRADAAVMASELGWTIFRPGLVIAPNAYGAGALLRALAAIPLVQPVLLSNARLQCISIDDVCDAVLQAVGEDLSGQVFDLMESNAHSFEEIVLQIRRWLGFSEPKLVLALPRWIGSGAALLADLAGWFGWRAPFRSTALKVLERNVTGDPSGWAHVAGGPLGTLECALARYAATRQERIFARGHLIFPFLILILAAFWIVSGLLGLTQSADAIRLLTDRSVTLPVATGAVFVGSFVDLLIGAAFLFRGMLRRAVWLSTTVCILYLVAGTILTPDLWADPLGPIVKIVPVIGLALAVAALAEDR